MQGLFAGDAQEVVAQVRRVRDGLQKERNSQFVSLLGPQ